MSQIGMFRTILFTELSAALAIADEAARSHAINKFVENTARAFDNLSARIALVEPGLLAARAGLSALVGASTPAELRLVSEGLKTLPKDEYAASCHAGVCALSMLFVIDSALRARDAAIVGNPDPAPQAEPPADLFNMCNTTH